MSMTPPSPIADALLRVADYLEERRDRTMGGRGKTSSEMAHYLAVTWVIDGLRESLPPEETAPVAPSLRSEEGVDRIRCERCACPAQRAAQLAEALEKYVWWYTKPSLEFRDRWPDLHGKLLRARERVDVFIEIFRTLTPSQGDGG